MFKQVQSELKSGKRKIVDFNISNFQEETFYVHNGVLFYLEKIDFSREDHYREDGTRVRKDGRTRCVFENGTESNMLKRSVEKMLYENGRAVTHSIDTDEIELLKNAQTITNEDNSTGFIYVLSSLSNDPKIKEIQHLYKIGYSTIPVQDRIKNAEKEPTYLMAPVRVESEYETYNMNTQKFEQLLHNFFGSACLNVDVYDLKGKRHIPQEWFIAPIHIIDRVINLILKGEIINYVYHLQSESIIKK